MYKRILFVVSSSTFSCVKSDMLNNELVLERGFGISKINMVPECFLVDHSTKTLILELAKPTWYQNQIEFLI